MLPLPSVSVTPHAGPGFGKSPPLETYAAVHLRKSAVLRPRPTNRITCRMGIRRPTRSYATRRATRTRHLDAVL